MANNKPSIEELKAKAESGDVESQKLLGKLYRTVSAEYGIDKPDWNKSIQWYKRAADQDDADANFALYELFWSQKNTREQYLKKAVELGHSEARFLLAAHYMKIGNQSEALNLYNIAMNDLKLNQYHRATSAYELGSYYESYNCGESCVYALDLYKKAAEWGDCRAAYAIGCIYEIGCFYVEDLGSPIALEVIKRDPEEAARWFLRSAEMGHVDGMIKSAEWYKSGRGFTKNDEKSFKWMLIAACNLRKHCVSLSEYYKNGVGVDENPYEAYVWAVMARENFDHYELIKLESKLTKKDIRIAQKEAEYRVDLTDGYYFPEKLIEYMIEKHSSNQPETLGQRENNQTQIATPGNNTTEHQHLVSYCETQDDDPDPSPGIAYSYLSVCKKHFNPELVTLELVVPRKLKKTETLDFTRLKISYDGRNTDAKNREVLTPFRINRAERQLLIRLAAQFSVADPERRAAAIQKILSASRESTRVSHLNAMFRAIFSGCAKTRDERMINRQSGYIAPKLKIDTTKITNARDYPLCGL